MPTLTLSQARIEGEGGHGAQAPSAEKIPGGGYR
jgi:hypothetical protein